MQVNNNSFPKNKKQTTFWSTAFRQHLSSKDAGLNWKPIYTEKLQAAAEGLLNH